MTVFQPESPSGDPYSQRLKLPIADFILDRLAEDEAAAREASPAPWHTDAEGATVFAVDNVEVCDGFALSGPQTRATTAHIARHDPARVLREVEAKREIVEEHGLKPPDVCSVCSPHDYPCPTLRALAAVYADHEDYRPEWAL